MKIIADLHIHSRYSMATSKLGCPEYLDCAGVLLPEDTEDLQEQARQLLKKEAKE